MKYFHCTVIALLAASTLAVSQPTPLPAAHSHNDYVHERPLLDALDHGFCSVEADIHLVDGALLVAHDLGDVVAERTLQALYLNPLRQRIRQNNGSVYRDGPPFTLLIDVKSDAEETYKVLNEVLRRYADILSISVGDSVVAGPVTAIVSGNRARESMRTAAIRFAGFDGRLDDLTSAADLPVGFMPLVSSNWMDVGGSAGQPGKITAEGLEKMRDAVALAHDQGRRLRFWGTGDHPETWSLLKQEGVDLLNADDLEALQHFLQKADAKR